MQPTGTVVIDATNRHITYTLTGAQPLVIGIGSADWDVIIKNRRVGKRFDFTKQDGWGNAAPPATGLPNFLPDNRQWGVVIKRLGLPDIDIPMGFITNEPTWTNDQTGAQAAQQAIRDAFI